MNTCNISKDHIVIIDINNNYNNITQKKNSTCILLSDNKTFPNTDFVIVFYTKIFISIIALLVLFQLFLKSIIINSF